jgi:hypothetical protein
MARDTLPPEFRDQLLQLRTPGMFSPALAAALAQAHREGWTYMSLAAALDISRQHVAGIAGIAPADARSPIHIPAAPAVPPSANGDKYQRRLGPKKLRELIALRRESRKAKGNLPMDHPARLASERFSALLNMYIEEGHSITVLGNDIGMSYTAIRFRLGRAGFRKLPPSQVNKYR